MRTASSSTARPRTRRATSERILAPRPASARSLSLAFNPFRLSWISTLSSPPLCPSSLRLRSSSIFRLPMSFPPPVAIYTNQDTFSQQPESQSQSTSFGGQTRAGEGSEKDQLLSSSPSTAGADLVRVRRLIHLRQPGARIVICWCRIRSPPAPSLRLARTPSALVSPLDCCLLASRRSYWHSAPMQNHVHAGRAGARRVALPHRSTFVRLIYARR